MPPRTLFLKGEITHLDLAYFSNIGKLLPVKIVAHVTDPDRPANIRYKQEPRIDRFVHFHYKEETKSIWTFIRRLALEPEERFLKGARIVLVAFEDSPVHVGWGWEDQFNPEAELKHKAQAKLALVRHDAAVRSTQDQEKNPGGW